MLLIGVTNFLERHRSSKSCAPSHKSNLWNILEINDGRIPEKLKIG